MYWITLIFAAGACALLACVFWPFLKRDDEEKKVVEKIRSRFNMIDIDEIEELSRRIRALDTYSSISISRDKAEQMEERQSQGNTAAMFSCPNCGAPNRGEEFCEYCGTRLWTEPKKGGTGMAVRKIDLMHQMFGRSDGLCKDCSHYQRYHYRDKPYRKCEVYGVTASEASDWVGRYQACGLFNKPYPYMDNEIIRYVTPERKKGILNEPLDGQMDLF